MFVFNSTLRKILVGPILILALVSLSACGDEDTEVATEPTTIPVEVSPGASDLKPEETEVATLDIRDGDFSNDELILQQEVPTSLEIVNHDDTAYQFRIDELVSDQEIAASDTTRVSFTTPLADTFTGQLLSADDDSVLGEITVTVQGPGGVGD